MARLNEKNVASVKKTVSVAAPTGPLFSAFDLAQSKKLVQNMAGRKAADTQVGALVGLNRTAAAQGKGKPAAAQGKQAATPAKGKGAPVAKAIAKAGHDTGSVKADDAVYDKLHGCCNYQRIK